MPMKENIPYYCVKLVYSGGHFAKPHETTDMQDNGASRGHLLGVMHLQLFSILARFFCLVMW